MSLEVDHQEGTLILYPENPATVQSWEIKEMYLYLIR